MIMHNGLAVALLRDGDSYKMFVPTYGEMVIRESDPELARKAALAKLKMFFNASPTFKESHCEANACPPCRGTCGCHSDELDGAREGLGGSDEDDKWGTTASH